jgi:CHAT domain-containing protein
MSDYIVSSYTPTLTALLRAQQKSHVSIRSQLKLSVVAVAHTNTRALPTIKGVRQEASEIAAIAAAANISCDVKLEATKSQASAAFMTANLLHIASHGIQDESDPLKSAFILADGDLSTSEIMDMNLDNAFLAFLSSCETAKGDQNYADEVIHLAATMIFAGFTSVVASMW